MDDTLLRSDKTIGPATKEAISKAEAAGRIVTLCTGRSVVELDDYLPDLPGVAYAVCTSGSVIYDIKNRKILEATAIPEETVISILEWAEDHSLIPILLTDQTIVQKKDMPRMEEFHIAHYVPLYENHATFIENALAEYKANPYPIVKINLQHKTPEDRAATRKHFEDLGLPLAIVDAEAAMLEFNPAGVNKGVAFLKLCELLHIDAAESIAVGDGENDENVLRVAGLGIAMGNSVPLIRDLCPVHVADCNHDGCAEAIYQYLMRGDN